MIVSTALLIEQAKVVPCLLGVTPSGSTPQRVSLKNYSKVTFFVFAKNATTVTGSAITLKQSTTIAGAGEKAIPFARVYQNLDTSTGDELTAAAVTGNTFTTDATNGKTSLYALEVRPDDLDADGGFDVVGLGTGNATATTLTVIAVLWPAKAAGLPLASATTD